MSMMTLTGTTYIDFTAYNTDHLVAFHPLFISVGLVEHFHDWRHCSEFWVLWCCLLTCKIDKEVTRESASFKTIRWSLTNLPNLESYLFTPVLDSTIIIWMDTAKVGHVHSNKYTVVFGGAVQFGIDLRVGKTKSWVNELGEISWTYC